LTNSESGAPNAVDKNQFIRDALSAWWLGCGLFRGGTKKLSVLRSDNSSSGTHKTYSVGNESSSHGVKRRKP